MIDPDIFWHLKVGQEIYTTGGIPHFDHFSHTMPYHAWVDHEALTEVWFYLMYSSGFWWILKIIFSLIISIPFIFWIYKSNNYFLPVVILFSSIYLLGIAGVRPQWISFLLFFVVFQILLQKYWHKKNNKSFYFLPLIFLVWANLHAGFFMGLMTFGFLVMMNLFQNRNINQEIRPIIILGLSTIVTLINPYGWHIYEEIFKVATSSSTLKYIAEWQPVFTTPDLSLVLFGGVFISFILIFKSYKKYPLPFLALSLIMFCMFLMSKRHGPLFFITSMPIIFNGFEIIKNKIYVLRNNKPFSQTETNKALSGVLILFIIALGSFGYKILNYQVYKIPENAVIFLKENKYGQKDLKLFNNYGWGGYLIWETPEIKVFIDGRMPHWQKNKESAMSDYIKTVFNPETEEWKKVFNKYKINTVIMPANIYQQEHISKYSIKKIENKIKTWLKTKETTKNKTLVGILKENGWSTSYQDDVAIVLECEKDCY
ncbi:MAG: hypothetical protein COV29_04180 [Candidatus Yanofskybacteria bacterium CG10_big_fil_rev_8_21_14_0_10_36_16]|uniref:Glycosyltransferase RgtA/B/C/D-like domain-containing protein n=1 Tax=Candidatus Yanofskybacteria bacterium CG10_big_fil_rev_8_21_14_0_10_36_16 TaxID=1975096 RepID=A0A2J0Q6C2_9BACT|nr:MAG: hypothetical protein COV29_04180 [Candidatus Yanofskybacteria bacterium CG10_big_fil_rev_8_21_14_0_10_36_16]